MTLDRMGVSAEAGVAYFVHEKNVRHRHISIFTSGRRGGRWPFATLIATLLPDPGDPEERRRLIERIGRRVVPKSKKKANDKPVKVEYEEMPGAKSKNY
jgi:hypothetical protein